MNIAANGIRRHLLSIARRIEWQELNKHNSGQQMLHLATCTFVSTKLRAGFYRLAVTKTVVLTFGAESAGAKV